MLDSHSYCILPENAKAFWQMISNINTLDDTAKEQFYNSQIQKVQINPQYSSWDIYLKTTHVIADNHLNKVSEHLKRFCHLNDVTIYQDIENQALTEHIKTSIQTILKSNFKDVLPMLVPDEAIVRLPHVYVLVFGSISIDFLKSKHVDTQLQEILKEQTGQELQVEFKTFFAADKARVQMIQADHTSPPPPQHPIYKEPSKPTSTDNSTHIFGRDIKGKVREISSLNQEENKVIVQGSIYNVQTRELRTKRILLTFDIVDNTDGMSCKIFFTDEAEYKKLGSKIKSGLYTIVQGNLQHDKFAQQDLTMMVTAIKSIPQEKRMDTATDKRVELHLHTKMSSLDAVVPIKDCIKTAAAWGHSAVAITDHGVVQAFPEAYEVASNQGIKLIYGMEGYLFEDNVVGAPKYWHIIILAKNEIGLRNLYKLVSLSHLKYLYRRPRIPRSILNEYRDGLILGSACEAGELYQGILRGDNDEKLEEIASFYDYLEIQPIGNNKFLLHNGTVKSENELCEHNKKICAIGKKLNKRVVATCDVHFLEPEHDIYREILMTAQRYPDAGNQPPLYFRTTAEMLAEFTYLGDQLAREVVITNTQAIANEIDNFKPIPDELYSPKIDGAEDAVRDMSYDRAHSLYGEELPQLVQERLNMELNSIINNGFAVLYLIAHKLVKKSLDDGYLVGSRGSVGSSFVATMMDITEVNPLPPHWRCRQCNYSEFIQDGSYASGFDLPPKNCPKCLIDMQRDGHDIPFAVFMGFHGDKVPDIDLNFSGDYQPHAHKYTEELFGRDNVFRAGTISTLADKTAYGFVKRYYEDKGITQVREAKINALVSGCTGIKRTTGQHPGGIMVVPRDMDIHYFTPIQRPADDKDSNTITTHFDYHSISSRLVKLDILGHDDPTVIKMLEDLTDTNAMKVPVGDPATMSLFYSCEALGVSSSDINSNVGTFGIPEFGTKFVRQMLDDIKPNKFSELVRVSGFSHGTDVWLNNAQDLIRSGTATVLETISARDDIMVYLIQKGLPPSNAFKIMENVRKGKGVTPEQAEEMLQHDVPQWYIESCRKIKYMFPKAHAVAYVLMAYRIAYYKVHRPLAFYAAYFSIRADEFDANIVIKGKEFIKNTLKSLDQKGNEASNKEKALMTILELALEMNLRGFDFLPVDLYASDATKFIIEDTKLRPPLSALQGVGVNAAINIANERQNGKFISKEDLINRAGVNKTVVEKLTEHGTLDDLPDTNQIVLFA